MERKKYNDVLSEMREKIDIGKIGVQVDKLRRTNGRDLLVKVELERGCGEVEGRTGQQNERDGHGNPKKGDFLHDYELRPWDG
ncbi:unnamed protein product [Diabrotica balteata]|uniref:Uncharacterized protein n=1 Tax=Diabrotica balteata TaxID=107213 RepID=A0A9N9T349_DIABA|nr:unnamed protein product [Diabrotica balteata]